MSCSAVFCACLVRVCLFCHSLLAIWRVTVITNNAHFFLLALPEIGAITEAVFTIGKRRGQEYKWFCPCFLFFLLSTVPAIWILELGKIRRLQITDNQTVGVIIRYTPANDTSTQAESILGIEVPPVLDEHTWITVVEQTFLYLMVVGRWVLPRGHISRDELSKLLFIFIERASDIIELLALFRERVVRDDVTLTYVILSVWSLSLIQFTLVVTARRRPEVVDIHIETGCSVPGGAERPGCLCGSEVRAIFLSICLQDIPFLVVRVYTAVVHTLITYTILFFTAKNLLLVVLNCYRLLIMCHEQFSRTTPRGY
ncbi:hypothetical protein ScPMuIL_003711 [Solemya velum]